MASFKSSDILLAFMTDVGIVPAMRRAVAIVTDVGGVTCHAAIIAREFGIPCIIGTKLGTEALKDGCLVDVNADEGLVEIKCRKPFGPADGAHVMIRDDNSKVSISGVTRVANNAPGAGITWGEQTTAGFKALKFVQVSIGQDSRKLQNLVERGVRARGFDIVEYEVHTSV